jgi:hypothetical protein
MGLGSEIQDPEKTYPGSATLPVCVSLLSFLMLWVRIPFRSGRQGGPWIRIRLEKSQIGLSKMK